MIKKLRATILSLSALFMLAVPSVMPAAVYAADANTEAGLCSGAELQLSLKNQEACQDTDGDNLTSLIKRIINIMSIIVGAVAVIMIIIGGFRYVTSGGNDSNVAAAKNTILYAIIGLVIVAVAQVIVRFVLNTLNV